MRILVNRYIFALPSRFFGELAHQYGLTESVVKPLYQYIYIYIINTL
jgi:hypothetical protein